MRRLLLCLVLLVPGLALAQTATSITIEGQAVTPGGGNGIYHSTVTEPVIAWTFTPSAGCPTCVQTNWQVQVDNDTATGSAFYWTSRAESKPLAGDCLSPWSNTLTSVPPSGQLYRNCDDGTLQSADAAANAIEPDRAHYIRFFRVRLCEIGTPSAPGCIAHTDTTWGPWTDIEFARNHPPYWAQSVTVIGDATVGSAGVSHPSPNPSPRTMYVDDPIISTCTVYSAGVCGDAAARPFNGGLALATRQLAAGDTLRVLPGVYSGASHLIDIEASTHATGSDSRPIQVVADNQADRPILAVTSGTFGLRVNGTGCTITNWLFDGVLLRPGSTVTTGVSVGCGSRINFRRLGIDPASTMVEYPTNGGNVLVGLAGDDHALFDSKLDKRIADTIRTDGIGSLLAGNEISNNGLHVLHSNGAQLKMGVWEDNWFHDLFGGGDSAFFMYLSSSGTSFRDNVFDSLKNIGGTSRLINMRRSGGVLLESNTIWMDKAGLPLSTDAGTAIRFDVEGGYNWLRGNVIINGRDQCIRASDGHSGVGARVENNICYDFTSATSGIGLALQSGNCFTVTGPACDPLLTNGAGGDFTISSGASAAVETGHASSPVPIGGGTVKDMGRFEFGASPLTNVGTYEDAARFVISDSTPTIQFRNNDFDWLMIDELPIGCSPTHPTDPTHRCYERMTGYQIQIDTTKRFNSWDGIVPLFDSGIVTTGIAAGSGTLQDLGSYTLHTSNALTPGLYYLRVRTADTKQSGILGAWSVPVRFQVSGAAATGAPIGKHKLIGG